MKGTWTGAGEGRRTETEIGNDVRQLGLGMYPMCTSIVVPTMIVWAGIRSCVQKDGQKIGIDSRTNCAVARWQGKTSSGIGLVGLKLEYQLWFIFMVFLDEVLLPISLLKFMKAGQICGLRKYYFRKSVKILSWLLQLKNFEFYEFWMLNE